MSIQSHDHAGVAAALLTPGFQRPAVEAWLKSNVPQLEHPLRWTRLEGGHSNLTYLMEDGRGIKAVIRRPPQGELLPKAHDMGREWALISALHTSCIPVPTPLGFCDDSSLTGAHFYVMGFVDGHPLYNTADAERWVPPASRTRMAHSFIDVLADLHSLDPDQLGLSDLGKKDDYLSRQLKTWYRSWNASIAGAEYDDPRAHRLQAYFLAHLPNQGPARVVHGDYGLHNCLIGANGSIAAVLDWEISTLGDPLADLGYALNQWAEPDDPPTPRGARPTSLPGFPKRRELAARYGERTGRDLSRLDYYLGFNHWKSAAIVHGVYSRYKEGKKSTDGVDMPALLQSVQRSLQAAEEAVGRLPR
jgi:aminoglycoside phosphotransferase (APT) family kinase protein